MRRLLTIAIVGGAVGACGTFLDTTPTPQPYDAGAPGDAAGVVTDDAAMTGEPGATLDAAAADGEAGLLEPRCQVPFHEKFAGNSWDPAPGGWLTTGATPTSIGAELVDFRTPAGVLLPSYISRTLKGDCPLHVELRLKPAGVAARATSLRRRTSGSP